MFLCLHFCLPSTKKWIESVHNSQAFLQIELIWMSKFDYQLNFDIHISLICRKASRQLNILKRLGWYLDRLSKLTIFHTFILSNFNFCPLAWHFVPIKIQKNLRKCRKELCIRWLHQFIYQPSWKSSSTLLADQTY